MTDRKPSPELLRRLLEPSSAEAAARELVANPIWRKGAPPGELVSAWADPRHDRESVIVQLARGWERPAISEALLRALENTSELEPRRRLAWILKQTATPSEVQPLLCLAVLATEDRVVRRYALEAITPLEVDWSTLEPAVDVLRGDQDALIREGAAALVGEGEDNLPQRRTVLVELLQDSDPSVLVTTLAALKRFSLGESELPAEQLARLYDHPRPDVRSMFRELMQRKS